jgi:protein phosphatase
MRIVVPELSLVVLVGVTGSGKSTFARRHFLPTEIVSSDYCRGVVSDDENDQTSSKDAFELLHFIAGKRLSRARLTVIDATNVQPESRKPLIAVAREYHSIPIAIVFNIPERLCHERNRNRPDRDFGPHVIRQQRQQLRRSLRMLEREGFRHVYVLNSPEEVEAATIERQPLWNNRRSDHGPFDMIGDVHGCCDELEALLQKLGYGQIESSSGFLLPGSTFRHPGGRKAIFLGDLVDRGPRILDTLALARNMVGAGSALCIPGNHDIKLLRKLRGRNVQITHGLDRTLAEIDRLPEASKESQVNEIKEFIDSLISHFVLDDGKLVVAHAGMKQEMQGRGSGKVRDFALYGETTGETDEFGLPVRYNWAAEYRGEAIVVYGHTPVLEPEWLNRTINIDTGCVFGGKLTALRYPERELVSVDAKRIYFESAKPFRAKAEVSPALTTQQELDDILDLEDVSGKRIIATRLHHNVTIREENTTAALEVMSRFAVNPKWLIYLPPTMSPCETSQLPGLLEHPAEAFAYFRHEGVGNVVCQEKHMGSRAVVVICKDEQAARRRFGVIDEGSGICYTRTGRRFFDNREMESALLDQVRSALTEADFWRQFHTEWACLDCELMPWSVKAQELVRQQYAAVGAAGRTAFAEALPLLQARAKSNEEVQSLFDRYAMRYEGVSRYPQAYRNYCWPVQSIADLKLAPFHFLATEGKVHVDQSHEWHMNTLSELAAKGDPTMVATPYKVVDVTNPSSEQEAIDWWFELTSRGGEGMVVKPLSFIAKGQRGLTQPAVKCRGREYLRIIYGPEYSAAENLERLRSRGLFRKRSLALREFALGVEALERFVRREPLRRVHECVFGVLALESEPIDPRL